jgi:hypothetical protein
MEYLIKDKKLKLKYQPGKGAWTYHIQIPNTRHIKGKWGTLKVTGYIDGYKIESLNLFTITGQDKLISVNEKIRKAINKTAGDFVEVTLSLLTGTKLMSEKEILDTFMDGGVLKTFEKIPKAQRKAIIETILAEKTEEKQIKMVIKQIDWLAAQNS